MSNETEKLYIVATVKGSSVMWVQPNAEAVGDRDGLCRHADAAAIIAQRDARIVELEASKAAADDMFRSLGGEIYELNAKLAALKAQPLSLAMEVETEGWWNESHDVYTWPIRIANWGARIECHGNTPTEAQQLAMSVVHSQQPSAGVVMPPQCTDKQAHVKYRCGWNSCLSAVTRLNQPGNAVTVLPDGWVPLTIEHEEGYPEDVAFGPQRMMGRLKKWLDRYFAMRLNPPGECVAVPRELLADLVSLDREKRIPAERHLYALLAQQKESGDE